MILKSFYHKKSTKVYLIIITITIIAIMSMFLYKNKIIELGDIANEHSFIAITSKEPIDISIINSIKDDSNFKSYCEGFANHALIKIDDSLKDNEAILPKSSDKKTGSIYNYMDKFELVIKDIYDDNVGFFIYVSREMYNTICNHYKNYGYIIYVNNWHERQRIMDKLSENNKITVNTLSMNFSNVDYDFLIYEINIFIKIILTIFVIVNIIVIFNIIHDQKYKIGVYKSLGYNKSRINKYQFINIISLYITSSVIATIVSYLLYLFVF